MTSKPDRDEAVVIDATNGMVLAHDNLYFCWVDQKDVDRICANDSEAFAQTAHGAYIPPSLMEFLLRRKRGEAVTLDELRQVFFALRMDLVSGYDHGNGTFTVIVSQLPKKC